MVSKTSDVPPLGSLRLTSYSLLPSSSSGFRSRGEISLPNLRRNVSHWLTSSVNHRPMGAATDIFAPDRFTTYRRKREHEGTVHANVIQRCLECPRLLYQTKYVKDHVRYHKKFRIGKVSHVSGPCRVCQELWVPLGREKNMVVCLTLFPWPPSLSHIDVIAHERTCHGIGLAEGTAGRVAAPTLANSVAFSAPPALPGVTPSACPPCSLCGQRSDDNARSPW